MTKPNAVAIRAMNEAQKSRFSLVAAFCSGRVSRTSITVASMGSPSLSTRSVARNARAGRRRLGVRLGPEAPSPHGCPNPNTGRGKSKATKEHSYPSGACAAMGPPDFDRSEGLLVSSHLSPQVVEEGARNPSWACVSKAEAAGDDVPLDLVGARVDQAADAVAQVALDAGLGDEPRRRRRAGRRRGCSGRSSPRRGAWPSPPRASRPCPAP